MRRLTALASLALLVAGVAAAPVGAHEGHASCKAFGQTHAQLAQELHPFGQAVSFAARQGFNAALVEESHTTEGLCEAK